MPLRPLRAREIIRKLERAGFTLRRQTGSHARYVHPSGHGVTVPVHPGDVPVPVIRSILRQAGLTEANWDAL
ncbi:MAG: type II toxin-antitoxin system HicA family toxin [Candidatus Rokubacteria bacterium]|nr:type II toxin-antitoxin system HicA family toxin [Candidatus Rokubacteria bacterium]